MTKHWLGAAALVAAVAVAPVAGAADIVKSPADDREFAAFTLENGLGVVVVSDPTTDKAAASLDVNVGSGSDPQGRQGLAHFLEHMLFLGTDKYPDPNEYKAFITSHGGSNNAYTSFDHTNYFFDVKQAYLEPALDRFAQFFIAPRFDPRYVASERQVVHSEYVSKLRSDGRRIWDASKQVLDQEHPGSNFAVGSLETLADREGSSIRDELTEFYRKHYSAGIMRLAVVGREPVEALRAMVEERFSAVPNTGAEPQRMTRPRYRPGTLPARLDIIPVRERRSVSFTFPIPPVRDHWRTKPTHPIADLIGHEGEGSLLAMLKRKGWVEGLSAGIGSSEVPSATFTVSMQLTESGLDNLEAIGESLFSYIDLVRREGLSRWRYEELRRLSDLRFRFEERGSAVGTARGLAAALHLLPPEEVLRGAYALERFDEPLIRRYADRLTPDNVLVTVVAKGLETDSVTEHFETEYRLRPLPEPLVAAWSDAPLADGLALPGANPFIPESLAVLDASEATERPRRILERPGIELWHQVDSEFRLPRTDFYFSVRSPVANDTARHALLTMLYVDLVNDELNAFSYAADLAGMDYALYKHLRGFSVRFSGYSDKEAMLVERIVDAIAAPRLDPARFEVVRAELARGLRNAATRTPARRATGEIYDLLLDPNWTEAALLAEVDAVTVADLEAFVPKLLGSINVVALAHGNIGADKATGLAELVESRLVARARPVEVSPGSIVALAPGDRYLRTLTSEHQDSALVAFYQGDARDFATRARFALLAETISSPFFDVLRTEKQLGYVVYSQPLSMLEVPGLAFVVQSPSTAPDALAGHVEAFVRDFAATVDSMSEEQLARHKASVVSRILVREPRLDVRTNRYWTEIDREHFGFDSRERLADAVSAIDLETFRAFYREVLMDAGKRGLVVANVGTAHASEPAPVRASAASGASVVEDATAFKASKARIP